MKYIFIIILIIGSLVPIQTSADASQPARTTDIVQSGGKRIDIDLSEQRLRYYFGDIEVNSILISSGLPRTPTPVGEFTIDKKLPFVRYMARNRDGSIAYDFPRTKWNVRFFPKYWIHGAYWHNNFGNPMSHGCVNVAYKDMEQLYIFAEIGTKVYIHE